MDEAKIKKELTNFSFVLFVCLFVAVWRCKKFVCFDFFKDISCPKYKKFVWWLVVSATYELAIS